MLSFLALSLWCDEEIGVNMTISSNRFAVNDIITLKIEVSSSGFGSAPEPVLPSIDFGYIVKSYTSSNYSMVNGKMSSSKSYTYQVKADKSGRFTIQPATVTYRGKTYKSNAINVQVGGNSNASQGTNSTNNKPTQSVEKGLISRSKGSNTYITTSINKKQVYLGEPIILTFTYYTRENFFDSPQYSAPETPGFWKEDLQNNNRQVYKIINGMQYAVQEINYLLFATNPGKKTIGPAKLVYTRGGFFNSGQDITLTTNPLEVEILALPEKGKPANFSGLVSPSEIKMSASLSSGPYKANEGITLTLNIVGKNVNLKGVSAPKITSESDLRVFDPEISTDIQRTADYIITTKTFKYLIIPQFEGKQTIKVSDFSYFHTGEKIYKKFSVNDIWLDIQKGKESANNFADADNSTPIAQRSRQDIEFIKTNTDKLKNEKMRLFDKTIISLFTAGIFLIVLSLLIKLVILVKYSDPVKIKSDKAFSLAKSRIKKWQKNDKAGFTELRNIMLDFINDKYNIQAHGMLISELQEILAEKIKIPSFVMGL